MNAIIRDCGIFEVSNDDIADTAISLIEELNKAYSELTQYDNYVSIKTALTMIEDLEGQMHHIHEKAINYKF